MFHIKRIVMVFCMLIFCTGITEAATPDKLTQLLIRHATGETISRESVPKDLGRDDLTNWNAHGRGVGSQNLPMIARAAVGDYQWMAKLARLERKEGIFGRELGSPSFYFFMPVASKMVALRDARKAGAKEDADAIRLSLRAVWAYESLLAVDTPRTSTWMNASGDIIKGKGDSGWYQGLTVAVAGERWHSDRVLNHDDHGVFLNWALNWTPRKNPQIKKLDSKTDGWWPNVVAHLIKRTSYSTSSPAEPFGLTDDERAILKRVIKADPEAVKEAVKWLSEFGVYKNSRIRMRRTTRGTEAVFFKTSNGNKPAHAATSITTKGVWKSIRPSFYKGVGANKGYRVWIENGIIFADSQAGFGKKVSMTELGGKLLYELEIEGQTVKLRQGETSKEQDTK
ncbi:MAG: hypothetical protein ACYC27_05040 [Armatimonadota bacterium]